MTEIDLHDSDCATHNEPAYPNGPCDCSLLTTTERDTAHGGYDDAKRRNENKMTNPDELERLARAAYHDYALADIAVGGGMKATVSVPAFIAAANPATILALLSANREMRESLTVIANASEKSETMFGGKLSDVTRVFQHITRVARSALTTQRRDGE